MDYEKKIKEILQNEEINDDFRYKLAAFFPELKESEDERISKKVIDVLKLNVRGAESQMQASRGVDRTFEVYACNKVIAWLKKQGEQKSVNETPYPETLEKAIDLYYYSYGNGEGGFEHLSLEKFRDIVHTFVSDYGQKSAWSEDEKYFFNITCFLEHPTLLGKNNKHLVVKMTDWLKELKDRVQPQPKQEWSEKDKCMHYYVIDALKPLSLTTHSGYSINSMIDWLKSLKERYTWKPSDEQMEALEKNMEYVNVNNTKPLLKGLLEQLKKLREE